MCPRQPPTFLRLVVMIAMGLCAAACGDSNEGSSSGPATNAKSDGSTFGSDGGGNKDPGGADIGGDTTDAPGPATKVKAVLDPASIKAGGSAKVTCKTFDAKGIETDASTFVFGIVAPKEVTVTGATLTSVKAGTYDITCKVTGLTSEPATLEVKPGDPVKMELAFDPAKDHYKIEDTIKLVVKVKDAYDNPVAGYDPVMPAEVSPTDGVTVNAGGKSYSFTKEGSFLVTVTLKQLPTLSASKQAIVDGTGPAINVETPGRGETRDGDPKVKVSGKCVDAVSAVKSFTINDQPVTIAQDGSFSITMLAGFGMNPIVFAAEDVWGNKSTGVRAFYYSTGWFKMDGTPQDAFVPLGIDMWLGQKVLDDPPHSHKKPHDLASVFEIVLGSMDFGALLGSSGFPINQSFPVVGNIQGNVTVSDIKLGDPSFNDGYPQIDLTAIDGGIHMTAVIKKFSAKVKYEGDPQIPFVGPTKASGTILAQQINLDSDILITLDPTTKAAVSEAKNTDVQLQGLDVNLDGAIGFLTNWIIDLVKGPLTSTIEKQFEQQIGSAISDQLGSALSAFALNQDLEIKPFIGEGTPAQLHIATEMAQVEFVGPKGNDPGGGLLGMNASTTTKKAVGHVVLGSIGRAACLKNVVEGPSLVKTDPVQIALADDFLNELLFSIWYGGLLQLTIGADALGGTDLSQYGISNLSVETDFFLPPIVNGCLPDAPLKFQIGDGQVHAKLDFAGTPIDLTAFLSLEATGEITVVDDPAKGKQLGFKLSKIDFLELEVVQINAEAAGLKDTFISLLKGVAVPMLVDKLGSGLGGFPIPAFDLSSFSDKIPAGTKIEIDLQKIERKDGYTYASGGIKP